MTLRTWVREMVWSAAGRSGIAPVASALIHSPARLRILMYHDVPQDLIPRFDSHLKWLMRHFDIVSPADLLLAGDVDKRPKALLTFDDGCVDNYELIAPRLESCGLRGLFFVSPGFAGLSREASFALMERASVLLSESTRDTRWQRMSREQIVDLDRRGHGIGSHTLTHVPLTKVDQTEMTREIRGSSEMLASWLGHECAFFSWTYSWREITAEGLAIASQCHRYCFSPCSGLNRWPVSERLFWRTGVDVSRPVSHLQTQLSGVVDWFYRDQRRALARMWDERV